MRPDNRNDAVPRLFTIGYEGTTPDGFTAMLQWAGVRRLIDVRAVASSRRKGFSKTALAQGLERAGIEYRHLPAVGNPKPGRDAAKAGDMAEYERIYRAHLEEPATRAARAELLALAAERRSCLMCLEADPARCHRLILCETLAADAPLDIVHLNPRELAQ